MKSFEEILDYKLIIVDMDGTLYFQKPLRYRMISWILEGLVTGEISFRELVAIYIFRKEKEKLAGNEYEEDALYSAVTASLPKYLYLTPDDVKKTVHKWIYEIPLAEIPKCGDYRLINILKKAIQRGSLVYVFSDYPADKKVSALGLSGVTCISSTDEAIGMLKPCPKGIEYILEKTGMDKEYAIMIGDRDERDGLAARNADIDYIILKGNAKKRYEGFKNQTI